MRQRHPFAPIDRSALPQVWLVSDARNDADLERAIGRMGRGGGLIFRHYHLPPAARRARFDTLARMMRARGGVVILAGTMAQARRWGADGAYGAAGEIGPGVGLRLMTTHGLREMRGAGRNGAILLSPVFATRSHPGGKVLGAVRWRLLAARAMAPVIALGGMNKARARVLRHARWAAIDGLMQKRKK